MKFLLNMNVPRSLASRLKEEGYSCRHVGDIGLHQASDKEIMTEAERNGEIIITHDLDYSHLLAFSGKTSPSVIVFRVRNTHPDALLSGLRAICDKVKSSLEMGAIVILEDASLRIRQLPIDREKKLCKKP